MAPDQHEHGGEYVPGSRSVTTPEPGGLSGSESAWLLADLTGTRTVPCGPCAGTGEYPPTGFDVCSFCGGEGEVTESDSAPSRDEPRDTANSVHNGGSGT